jgi:hypothetical protein
MEMIAAKRERRAKWSGSGSLAERLAFDVAEQKRERYRRWHVDFERSAR